MIILSKRFINCSFDFYFLEYFFTQLNLLNEYVNGLNNVALSITTSQPRFDDLVISIIQYFYQLYYIVNCAKVTSHILPNIELGHGLDFY